MPVVTLRAAASIAFLVCEACATWAERPVRYSGCPEIYYPVSQIFLLFCACLWFGLTVSTLTQYFEDELISGFEGAVSHIAQSVLKHARGRYECRFLKPRNLILAQVS